MNYSEEEKEAIEYWKRDISLYHYNTQLCSEHYAQIILNLIEKQQKEIEDYIENKELINQTLGLEKNAKINKTLEKIIILNNFEDKIKAKIEYYEKVDNPVGKRVLQSLLEKE